MRVAWVGTHVPGFSRNRRLAEYLANSGVDVTVTRVDLWPDDRLSAFSNGRLRLAIKALMVYTSLFFRLCFASAPDLYLVSYPGWFDVPVVKLVALLKRRPVVFDVFIALSDTAVSDRGLANPKSAIARVTRLADRLALRSADVVVADSPAHGRFFSSLAGRELKVEVLYLGANEDVFHPRTGIPADPGRVLFYGTYVPLQGAEWIVRAARSLRERGDDARFVMVGNGQDRERIEALAATLDLDGIEFHDAMAQDDLVAEMHRASVVLGVFGTSDKANRVIPHKVFEAMAAGRPVLTSASDAIREAFSTYEVALSPAGDPEALATALLSLLKDDERLTALGSAGRAAFVDRYSDHSQMERLRRILESTVGRVGAVTERAAG